MTDPDPFGVASRRAAVLDAWHGSPTRLIEDSRAEADLGVLDVAIAEVGFVAVSGIDPRAIDDYVARTKAEVAALKEREAAQA